VHQILKIDAVTGVITIFNSSAIDYPQSFCTGVKITDGGMLSATTIYTVHTVKLNSPPVSSDKIIYINEQTPPVWTKTIQFRH
jgi:hypothetical protein